MDIEHAGAFACGAVVAWLMVFVWFPRANGNTRTRIRQLSLYAVSTIAVLAMCWSFAGFKGASMSALGLLVGASISFRVRQQIKRTYQEEIRKCK